ncbi:uncharacterized protein LOC125759295 [Rhipicephalus sanguineus]|uniref:uncharacterized protein LOC125759295 n=1 Tax=Rhipicephalus sanguineus TaxID=34632 RepID=UPI0020C2B0A7|nr:uncharacterized protein LOC125759295 [Rhipicephalus sanguineus]
MEGLEGTAVVMDDILVWGKSKEEHDRNLKSIKYLGHVLTCEGLYLDQEPLADILQVPPPGNKKELQTFLAPLRELLKKDAAWDRHQASFEALREALAKAPVLAYYQKNRPITLSSSSASKVISAFTDVFATHGFPSRLITDNGPPFSSQQFQDFIRVPILYLSYHWAPGSLCTTCPREHGPLPQSSREATVRAPTYIKARMDDGSSGRENTSGRRTHPSGNMQRYLSLQPPGKMQRYLSLQSPGHPSLLRNNRCEEAIERVINQQDHLSQNVIKLRTLAQ